MRKTRRIRITLLRIQIQLPKMMRIHADLDSQHCHLLFGESAIPIPKDN